MDSQWTPEHINEHWLLLDQKSKKISFELIQRRMHSLQCKMALIWSTNLQIIFQYCKKELQEQMYYQLETRQRKFNIGSLKNSARTKSYYQMLSDFGVWLW